VRALKSNNDIKGIAVSGREVTQFADDTTVFFKDHQPVINFLKLLSEFKHTSGLEINTGKTEAIWLGTWRNKTDTVYNFKWPQEPIQALGIVFSYNSDAANNLNYYMEESVLLGTKPLVDSIRHFIRDPSGVFSVCHL